MLGARMMTALVLTLCLVIGGAATVLAVDQQWEEVTSGYAGIKTEWWSVPAIADLDDDGDLDMLLGNGREIAYYRNDGNAYAPQWTFVTGSYADIYIQNDCVAPALADVDADSDYDLIITACGGNVYLYRNEGTPQTPDWTFVTDSYVPVPLSGCSHIPTLADMDADGDLDFFLDSCDWIAHYFENTGTAANASYQLSIYDFVNTAVGLNWYGNYIATQDIDLDGDLDVLASDASGYLAFLRNTGNAVSPQWSLVTTQFPGLYTEHTLDMQYIFPFFADIDGDGQNEVVMGDVDGYLSLFENTSEPQVSVEASVNIQPETLNLCSKGRWITAVVMLPEGYDPSDVVPDSVHAGGVLADTVNIEGNTLVVKFPRRELLNNIRGAGNEADVSLHGVVGDAVFGGSDSLRLVSCNGGKSGNILIVSDDNAQGYYGEFKTDLETLEAMLSGYDYTVYKESEQGNPSLEYLQSFDLVIWTTGVVWGEAPDAGDRETLKQYVSQGGRLFLTSTWAAYDAYYADDDEFLTDVLHAEYTAWEDQLDMEVLDASHPVAAGFTQGEIIDFDYPLIYENDVVYPVNGGVSVFGRGPKSYDPEASMVIVYDSGDTRVVYVASPLYLIPSAERYLLTENIVEWLVSKQAGKGKK